MIEAVDRVTSHAKRIADGAHDTIKPGMPFRIPDAWMHGDAGAQGDLVIICIDKVPSGYKLAKNLEAADMQLVPGNTEGAKHCLDSLEGVKLYRKQGDDDSLDGPCVRVAVDRVITHPKHGHWTIPAGRLVKIEYAREFDAEQKRERRARD